VRPRCLRSAVVAAVLGALALPAVSGTVKPVLHARHWLAITGKPLAATAGALTFAEGGNAVDAACAMLAATATMWDTLGWGGETQALVYHPGKRKVIGVNGLGVAPTGATADFFRERQLHYPPEFGPLAAVTPGTPGALMVMLAEFGRLSLAEVLAPAIAMADGYPIEQQLVDAIERHRGRLSAWSDSRAVFLPHLDECATPDCTGAPRAGELFRQGDLAATLRKLVESEREALAVGKSRREAILAAYDRFYRGDIAQELARATQEQGGLITTEDLARWQVKLEAPVATTYQGIEVFKLDVWTQGPAMLQALNLLENADLEAMGYNSARYIHTLYQAMSLAFADRDFYYGDPAFPPEEPVAGLLSKDYARARFRGLDWGRNDVGVGPGDPYAFQGDEHPFPELLEAWPPEPPPPPVETEGEAGTIVAGRREEAFLAGTTSIQAADEEGWVVSVTPSGAWVPAVVAGRTGIGLSQRMQSFVLDPRENPYNVVEPGKRPRVTLTPTLALKDGTPWLAFSVQGGDTQDQNLLQFFLDVVHWGMNVQEAAEAGNVNSYQMRSSFGDHGSEPGRMLVRDDLPDGVRDQLRSMGYRIETAPRTSGPITAILIDREHGTMWGAASDYGEDYGVGW
jgi:gamma-glutamyltranspeptidase/glutathione hydrolase